MREILFRGIRTDNNEWVYGLPVKYEYGWAMTNDKSLYHVDGAEWNFIDIKIDPKTVGQYTGMGDKNGKEIYEGDIVLVPEAYGGDNLYQSFIGVIEYDAPEFYVDQEYHIKKTGKWCGQVYGWSEMEIIGNKFENPELLK